MTTLSSSKAFLERQFLNASLSEVDSAKKLRAVAKEGLLVVQEVERLQQQHADAVALLELYRYAWECVAENLQCSTDGCEDDATSVISDGRSTFLCCDVHVPKLAPSDTRLCVPKRLDPELTYAVLLKCAYCGVTVWWRSAKALPVHCLFCNRTHTLKVHRS